MAKNLKKLTLLHSNDMHGDFLAENVDDKLVGGVAMLSGYVSKVRQEEENVIYAIAGDMFRGSVIDSEYKGISTIEIMNMIAPDVVTLGNHEVDYGIAHLLFLEKCARFPIINANMHITTNGSRLFRPFFVKKIGGMKVLFIGILTEDVLDQTRSEGLVGTFVDVAEAAVEIGRICNAYNAVDVDFTVLLTHIGHEEDKQLASILDPAWGVDVIIGGHSHTFIEEPAIVNGILIVQAGTGTDQIGRFDIVVDTDRNCVDSWKWQAVPIDEEHCECDAALQNLLKGFKDKTDEKYMRVITRLQRKLTHPCREQETELGNLFADMLQQSLGVDIMMVGSGSLRTEEMGPIVMLQDLMVSYPYDDGIKMATVTGAQFKRMIKYMCRDEVWEGAHCEFYQLSDALRITYDRETHEFETFNYNGSPMDDDALFTVGIQNYHFENFTKFFGVDVEKVSANAKPRDIATSCMQVFVEYLMDNQLLDSCICGRLTVL